MSVLEKRFLSLSKEKREAFLNTLLKNSPPKKVELEQEAHDGLYESSCQQEQLWFIDRITQGKAQNIIGLSFRIQGQLQIDCLEKALNIIIQRHGTLRTTFLEKEEKIYQEIHPYRPYTLSVETLSSLPQTVREEELEAKSRHLVTEPLNLTTGPLFRAVLFQLADQEYALIWAVHHIIWDAWSSTLFMQELDQAYSQLINNQGVKLPDLSVSYADYALWQRRCLQPGKEDNHKTFWHDYLKGCKATEIPTDFTRLKVNTFKGRRINREVSPELMSDLQKLAVKEGCTLYILLLTAFNIFLHYYTGQNDIAVGTPSANRSHQKVEPLLGFFVNMIVLRNHIQGNPTFTGLLKEIKDSVLKAFEHQTLPFEEVVKVVKPERDPGRHPLFQIEFTNEVLGGDAPLRLGNLAVNYRLIHDEVARFDMSLIINGSMLILEYNTELFQTETMEQLLANFEYLLQKIQTQPEAPIRSFSYLCPNETDTLLQWAHGDKLEIPAISLAEAFNQQVALTPERPALSFQGKSLSYLELNQQANRLAHFLLHQGVTGQERVGICLERSHEMIVAVLAILKAGAIYVPLDSAYPVNRQMQIIEEGQVQWLITREKLAQRLMALQFPLIYLDLNKEEIEKCETDNPVLTQSPKDLAYILFTSGSTGKPKGVMIQHDSVMAFSKGICRDYNIDQDDCLIQYASLGFDVSVFDIFTTLLVGGRLCIASEDEKHDLQRLTELLQKESVTVAELPPALLPYLNPTDFPALRLVSVGGEVPPGHLVATWANERRRFFNGYGPTETTVATVLMECHGVWSRTPPIGKPMANHSVYVLNQDLNLTPMYLPGELCIAGSGVARGYYNQPQATVEKFVPNPFTSPYGTVIYKTGDLVRWLPGGVLEFLGRNDHQIQLRGHRIELSEIEGVFQQISGIKHAHLRLSQSNQQKPILVAYLVLEAGEKLKKDAIIKYLNQQLPAYMIPARLIQVEKIPLNESGKVAAEFLPEAQEFEDLLTGPRNEVEEQILKQIFIPILKEENLGVNTNFFEKGGNSLEATQVISRMRSLFGVEVNLVDFFLEPTIEFLAGAVESETKEGGSDIQLLEMLAQLEVSASKKE